MRDAQPMRGLADLPVLHWAAPIGHAVSSNEGLCSSAAPALARLPQASFGL